eukprot:864401_1
MAVWLVLCWLWMCICMSQYELIWMSNRRCIIFTDSLSNFLPLITTPSNPDKIKYKSLFKHTQNHIKSINAISISIVPNINSLKYGVLRSIEIPNCNGDDILHLSRQFKLRAESRGIS